MKLFTCASNWQRSLLTPVAVCYSVAAFSQQVRPLTGRITDKSGEGLPGVTIVAKGTSTGAVTDGEGKYSLQVPASATTLVISFLGYKSQEVALNQRASIDVALAPDSKALDEVVVVGYGTQKKANLTGAVDQVTSKVLENRSVPNLTQGLQGVLPNLNLVP
ncbi:MAG: SusC/RagA family protein, partial [Hymenobacter sp.]